MPRPKGLPKTGGRAKGTPNRRTAELAERIDAMDCCPAEGLARIGQAAERDGNLDLARAAYSDLAPYLYARRKAVEHGGGLGLEQLITYSIHTGVPRGPLDPPGDTPAAPATRPLERAEAPPPPMPAPEAPRAPAPAARGSAGLPRIRILPEPPPPAARPNDWDRPAPSGGHSHAYDPFSE